MRTLVVTQNITVDGVVEAAGGWFDPTADGFADVQEAVRRQAAASDAFLVGRRTFEDMRGFWPKRPDDTTGVTDHLNRVAKYVVSRSMADPGWAGTTVLRGDLVDAVTALKEAPGADIVSTGSITLVHDLVRHGLVDEFRLFVHPVVLGAGRRLFEDATGLGRLRLLEARSFASGVVLQRYCAHGQGDKDVAVTGGPR